MIKTKTTKVWKKMESRNGEIIKVNIADDACSKFFIRGISLRPGHRFFDNKLHMKGTFVGISSTGHLCLSLDQYHGKVLLFDFLEAQRVLDENFNLVTIEDDLCQKEDLQDARRILVKVNNLFPTCQLPDRTWAGVGTISIVDKKNGDFNILLSEGIKNRLPDRFFKKEEFPRCTLPDYNIVVTMHVYTKERENDWRDKQEKREATKKMLVKAINDTGKKEVKNNE